MRCLTQCCGPINFHRPCGNTHRSNDRQRLRRDYDVTTNPGGCIHGAREPEQPINPAAPDRVCDDQQRAAAGTLQQADTDGLYRILDRTKMINFCDKQAGTDRLWQSSQIRS